MTILCAMVTYGATAQTPAGLYFPYRAVPAYTESLELMATDSAIWAEYDYPAVRDTFPETEVDPAFVADMLDSLVSVHFFKGDFLNPELVKENPYGFAPGEIPHYPDSIYRERLGLLNAKTPIELVYNATVQNFINLYAKRKKGLTEKMLGLAEIYFPLFEEQLDKYQLPLELKYLAVVESALNPTAGSRVGAKGLWQFMYGTGKGYNLKVNSYVDDRFDPLKATVAACEHLRDLHAIYHNWALALAAYNSGAGNVNRAIRRAGGIRNYWAIQPFLPRETRGYVPAFIAVNYIMSYAPEHNIYAKNPGILYNGIDTVVIHDVLHFDQISEVLNVPFKDVKFLNPAYKMGVIPATKDKPYVLRLPKAYIGPFIDQEKAIYAHKTKKGIEHDKLLAQIKKAGERQYHVVRSGENLGLIARKYHVYTSSLKKWNNLRSNTIYPGQRLVVFAPSGYRNASASAQSANGTHIVRRGETLGVIARKYHCSLRELRRWNNINGNTIYVKQKLKVRKPVQHPVAKKSQNRVEDGKYVYHIVRKGDTLWDIAALYQGVSVSDIKKLNHIRNDRRLKLGQKLKVSKKS